MPRYSDKVLEDALRKCQGMIYVAAKALGCSPNTIKARLEKSERLRALVEAESGYIDDVAELRLASAIINGEPWAIKYRLSTKGKSRGYTEKQEVEHSGNLGGGVIFLLPDNGRENVGLSPLPKDTRAGVTEPDEEANDNDEDF